MFDIGASELLMIVIVAVVVIGPKDMPLALRTAGRWIGKMRRMSSHFRSGLDAMVREAELEEMERKWREQNDAILKAHPQTPSLAEVEAQAHSAPQFGAVLEPASGAALPAPDHSVDAPHEPAPDSLPEPEQPDGPEQRQLPLGPA